MSLDLETGLELIKKANIERRDERLFQQWTAQMTTMALNGKPMSFDEYRDAATGANIDTRSTAELLAELDAVEKEFEK